MKLAPAEAKAIKFVLLILALSAIARFLRKPEPINLDSAQTISGGGLGTTKPVQERETPRGPLDPIAQPCSSSTDCQASDPPPHNASSPLDR